MSNNETVEKVFAAHCADYDLEALKILLSRAFEEIKFIPPGGKVLLKPNLVMGKPPAKAVNTHPLMVRAVAELLIDHGCLVYVGDSPGFESTEKALRASGIMDVVKETGLHVAPFTRSITRQVNGISPYREFVFGEDPDDYDCVINLPKLKTHGMTGITAGVKNTFGFIHGLEKARWHLRAGKDRMLFAAVLIDIHNLVKPSVTILDGILSMDGEGPTSGRPRKTGLLVVSRDAFALDRHVEDLMGLPVPLVVSLQAEKYGFLKPYSVVVSGNPELKDFLMPKAVVRTDWNLPNLVRNTLQQTFLRKPRVGRRKCKVCGVCREVCPAGAISLPPEGLVFDYGKCIRCYCCQEMCPEGAIRT